MHIRLYCSMRGRLSLLRNALSIVIHCSFLASRDLLAEKDYITPYGDERDHQYINEALKRKDILGSSGNDASMLRRARNVATYDTQDITTKTQQYARPLNWILSTAETIIDKVKQLPPRSTQ